LEILEHKLSKVTLAKARWQLREFLLPAFGKRQMPDITASDILNVLRRLEADNKLKKRESFVDEFSLCHRHRPALKVINSRPA
jgi:hypothetical protein